MSDQSKNRDFAYVGDHITLGQLLKAIDYVQAGGEVKQVLENELFFVNGDPENRRGKKLREGDIVTLPNRTSVTLKARV